MYRRCTHNLRTLAIGRSKPILVVVHIGYGRSILSFPILIGYRLIPWSTTSSNSHSSSIAEQNLNTSKKPLNPHRVSSIPEYQNIIAMAKPTIIATDHVRNISPVTFHPLQFPANFFVTHGISSPSSTSRRQSFSPRDFTFHLFFFTTKATPRFSLIH
jgi:hypothetical protein